MIPTVLVVGNVVADIVAQPVDEVPRTGSLHPAQVAFFPGGCAGNSAIGLARLGLRARLVACCGADALGSALLTAWEQHGVDISQVQRLPDEATGIAIVLVDSAGERRFISTPGANHALTPSVLTDALLAGAEALHIAGLFAAPGLESGALAGRLAEAQARGLLTSLDMVGGSARERRAVLYPLLPHLDLLLLNEDEAEKVTGEAEQAGQLAFLQAHGARTILLKRGERGCCVAQGAARLEVAAFAVRCVDSTGAGDAFAAALLASRLRGEPLEEAVQWASAAGAATTEALGATGAWRGWESLAALRQRAQPRTRP